LRFHQKPLDPSKYTSTEFSNETSGTNIPAQFVPAVKKGFLQSLEKGVLSGNKVTGVKFRLLDGANHAVDSSEFSFVQAAEGAMRQAYMEGNWQLIEPIMYVEIIVPSEFLNSVTGNLNKRNAVITTTENINNWSTIQCQVGLSDMFGYCKWCRAVWIGLINRN
jgi:elongation factor G